MIAAETMDGERLFAARAGLANSLCGLATWHVRRVAAS
jgi:hypothetical protein